MSNRWPFAGRTAVLREVSTLLRGRHDVGGALLAGPAGVGKTRLARAVTEALAGPATVIRWAAGTASAQQIPLGALGSLADVSGAEPAELIHRAAAALRGAAPPHDVVVAVDDAHLLDDVSALVLHQLAGQRQARLLLTVRSGEPLPDVLVALWKDGYLRRFDIAPMTSDETAVLLDTVLGGPVERASARRLWELTRGNVLFLRHLVDAEAASGRLRVTGGVWNWSGPAELPAGLAELIAVSMGVLSPAELAVTDLLALVEPLDVTVLSGLTDRLAVEAAEERGAVVVSRDGDRLSAGLAHPLYAEARRAAIGTVRARRLRGRIAQALPPGETLRRAVLAVDSDLPPDADLLIAGGRQAAQLCDLTLSERLGRAALAAGGGYAAQSLVAASLLGRSLFDRVDPELVTLTSLAGCDDERAVATVTRVLHLAFTMARPAEAGSALAEAQQLVVEAPATARLLALQAVLEGQGGRPRQSIASAEAALAVPDVPDEAVLLANSGLVIGLGTIGRADDTRTAAAAGLAAASRSTELAFFAVPMTGLWLNTLAAAGYLDEAEAIAADFQQTLGGQVFGAEISSCLIGNVQLAQGRVGHALRSLREARVGLARFGHAGGWRYTCLIGLAQAAALAGDVAEARTVLSEIDANRHPTLAFLIPAELLAQAWADAAEGAVSRARERAMEAAGAAATAGMHTYEMVSLYHATRFGETGTAGRLAELSTVVQGPRAGASAAHAAALATGDPTGLEGACAVWEQLGDLGAAADAAAQAAVVWAIQGRQGSSAGAAVRAARIAAAAGGLRTPALLAAARPLPLSEREREVITLAAAGLSNRQIADRLVLSVRTVEGHLYRAGAKVGVTQRSGFRDLLAPPSP